MIALALAAGGGGERILLCRPKILGDPALSRAESVIAAARDGDGRFLDYGVACEDAAEGARAARRAGLPHAIATTAEGRADGSRFLLVLADSDTSAVRARSALEVAPGDDAVRPLHAAFDKLLQALPPEPGPRPAHVAAWTVVGVGVAALVAGVVFTIGARDAADRAASATDLDAQITARKDWETKRRNAGIAYGVGGALVAGGLVWRFGF
ncbi:hypothetical protein [Anaeromyxobacter oryzae]|uniref:Uncharacterized protein n=1 Tax=Anaeromyxobacter oryzae TaxID=2918170 RepID=A0ABN6MQR7_9BACT|nr:hypothetical protein [Anaeromyxobacter oryzae]BDG03334.1 hypothetical protein AMOR_23300 [Anaeromyxobacter oryzae]